MRRGGLATLLGVTGIVVVALAALGSWPWLARRRARDLSRRVDAVGRELQSSVAWHPPRGAGQAEPSCWAEVRGLADELFSNLRAARILNTLRADLRAGREPSEEAVALARAHRSVLRCLDGRAGGPLIVDLQRLFLLSLALGASEGGAACLEYVSSTLIAGQVQAQHATASDAIGPPLYVAGVDVVEWARHTAMRCAREAPPRSIAIFERQVREAAAPPRPTFLLGQERLVVARGYAEALEQRLSMHWTYAYSADRRTLTEQAEEHLGIARLALEVRDASPASLDALESPLVASPRLGAFRWMVEHYMVASAYLRMLAIATSAIAHDGAIELAPAALSEPSLADPFTGRPFEWTRLGDGSARVSSPGHAGRASRIEPLELIVLPANGARGREPRPAPESQRASSR